MNKAPEFAPYPQAQAPVYSRWLVIGAVLPTLVGSSSRWFFGDFYGPLVATVSVVGLLLLWTLAFLLRVLWYRLNRHNAQCHAETVEQIQQVWWARHRQKAALVEAMLVGAAYSTPEHTQTPEGTAIRLCQVFGADIAERERQLAILLALHWHEQRTEPLVQPLCCYWQGSLAAWEAFVEQMAKTCPEVHLPAHPEPWQGIRSLNSIIDQLQGAPADARILCAGCQSSPIRQERRLPAGEGALLWLFGPQGRVLFSRGEWFTADVSSLTSVAERALQQSNLKSPAPIYVSFSQPDVPSLFDIGWNTKQSVPDASFGALEDLEAMVVLTLAAWHAERHVQPSAWRAPDPHYILVLGIVEPDDSSN
jgi:hypothetical protein